jgi:hypothetical protein
MDQISNPLPVLALVSDLMFAGRILAEARAAGVPLKMIRQSAQIAGQPGRRLIVDLNLRGAIEAAAQWRAATSKPVVGFVSHTDEQTIAQARAAGIDEIMPRSRFVQILPDLLKAEAKQP